MEGNNVHSDTITIPANGMDFIYLPASDGSPFVGSAYFDGALPFHGAVDEVKYPGNDDDTGHAMSYTMAYQAARAGNALALPLAWNPRFDAPVVQETTGFQIVNVSDDPTEIEISLFDSAGDPALAAPIIVPLDARASHTAYVLDIADLPDGFRGSAVVSNVGAGPIDDSAIVAVSNLVNYEVQYDGSSSFPLLEFTPSEPQIVCGGLC